eukprot:1151849-Pelagomonas_calceolata.AAC.2
MGVREASVITLCGCQEASFARGSEDRICLHTSRLSGSKLCKNQAAQHEDLVHNSFASTAEQKCNPHRIRKITTCSVEQTIKRVAGTQTSLDEPRSRSDWKLASHPVGAQNTKLVPLWPATFRASACIYTKDPALVNSCVIRWWIA